MALAGCANNSSPPPMPSPPSAPSPPSPPSSSPPATTPSPPSSQPPATTPSPPSSQPPAASDSEQLPGEQEEGVDKDVEPTWETEPAEGDAEANDSVEDGGGTPDGTDSEEQGSEGDESWDSAEPAAAEDGWETSNEIPGVPESPQGQPGDDEELPAEGSVAVGDDELDAALEDFDGEILAEREVIRARSNEGAVTTADGFPSPADTDAVSQPDGTVDVAGPRGIPSQRSAPPAPVPVATPIPDDIADAKDDDIITRQLREAAMRELDPELREKLWEEYRRYKDA